MEGTFTSEDFILDNDQLPGGDFKIKSGMGVRVVQDSLKLTGIDDKQFVKIINKWIEDSKTFYKTRYNLKTRRDELEKFRFGRQPMGLNVKDYDSRLTDSLIYESESYLTPIVFSKMPDIMITPGND